MTAPAPGSLRVRGVLWALAWAGVAFVLYADIGMVRYARSMAGAYDLGIFTQGAEGWASGHGPVSAIKGGSLFADHFSPITALFGLAWKLWPDPRSLLVMQAVTLGIAVGMIAAFARERLGESFRAAAVLAALVSGLPLLSAAIAAPHETALGAPMYAGLGIALYRARFRAVAGWSLACLLVKEDSGLIIAGAALAWYLVHRRLRQSGLLLALGVAGFVASNAVIWWVRGSGSAYYGYVTESFGGLDPARALPAVMLLGAAGLVVRDPLLLVAVPGIVWRSLSGNRNYWVPEFHYDVLTGIVGALVLIAAVQREGRMLPRRALVVGAMAAVGLGTAIGERPWRADPLNRPEKEVVVSMLLTTIPAAGTLAADQSVGAYVPPDRHASMFSIDRQGTLALTPETTSCWVIMQPAQGDLSGTVAQKDQWLAGKAQVGVDPLVLAATGAKGCPAWDARNALPRKVPS
ncbi:putative Membrane protein-like [Nostocoides australiense Ben110]|uniref:Putative Membrane protein-like n=1 Tax=Nostocoides australiense Ben110 TaxID=1193182 RepID=W6K397_9MICO|nr:DUF2079 domain-containing protein [Tetrasphaera australiensis]CCH72959.1 putative Membrane protein-like [Tetrasphaera australiensis Ben110]